jgi:hypothetical protein
VQLDDLEKSVAATTALFTRHLESAIRRYPEQWNWLGFPRNGKILRSKYQWPLSMPDDSSRAGSAPD